VRSWDWPTVPRVETVDPGDPVRVRDQSTGDLVEVAAGRDEVTLYVCGITPYDATHLGHAATYLLFDEVQRVCRDAGKQVRYVQNVTDVDDPLLERAAQTGEDWTAIAAREIDLFREDMAALRVIAPDAYVGVVEAVDAVAETVHELRQKGAAYEVDSDIYFSIAAAPRFGSVSRLPVAEMVRLSGERGGDPARPGKKDPLDSVLWQGAREGEPAWDTVVGRGRPGWHVECTSIALRHLGEVIDIQGGGTDLVFPHHETSAALAETITGQPRFAAAFVYQAMVGYEGEKMSKSRGNLVLVSALRAAGVDPMAIRLALLAHRHDADWEWHNSEAEAAAIRLARWRAAFARPAAAPAAPVIESMRRALRDALDVPAALDAVDAWVAADGSTPHAGAEMAVAVDALLGVV
jgi:L-cysteine:1D-myo-inositol 2-amino-2-deoxy-alpha-D-glucopyranoside ligase